MNYDQLTKDLSNKSGINLNLFDLGKFDTKVNDKSGMILLEKNDVPEYYYSSYEYWKNTMEGWKSIALLIPVGIGIEFLTILNSILTDQNEKLINIEQIPNETTYKDDDEALNLLLVQKMDNFFRIEFAKKNL